MTVYQRSIALWIGGAVVGFALAPRKRILAAAAGALIVGSIGDAFLEWQQRGEFFVLCDLRDRIAADYLPAEAT